MNTFLDILRDIVSAKLFIFISGFISGVLACWHFCPAYWEWRTHRLDVECKNKEERKAAALRRLESCRRRKAFEGLELHQSGTYYFDPLPGRIDAMFCRQCLENRLLRVKMNPLYHDPNRVHCPRCGFVGKRY